MRVVATIALVTTALGVLWLAGEVHYQSCIQRAVADHPPRIHSTSNGGFPEDRRLAGISGFEPTARKRLRHCSRLP